ncbi:MAG TPA: transglycosylase domain-containing protein [Candidatus Paceibacterota bacterium]|nr:transglycosylase domain-containing protein [Candidatus Paceibacterota bacterium]
MRRFFKNLSVRDIAAAAAKKLTIRNIVLAIKKLGARNIVTAAAKKLTIRNIAIAAIYALGGLVALAAVLFLYFRATLPSVAELSSRQIVQSTKIYDRTGTVLLYEINGGQKRTVVSFDQIPQTLKDATIAIEDQNFYNEPAFDWKAIVRAFIADFTSGGIVQGGSTITQQLAKNAYLSSSQTITRKIKEVILAIELNRHYSKDQILDLYLNEIPYGDTIYGVEGASEAYFGKHAVNLDLAQSATLAAIPRNPPYYSPWGSHIQNLMSRKNLVLQQMFNAGKITKTQLVAASAEKLVFLPQSTSIKAPHFVMAVEDYLVQKYGEDMVENGGLKVTTTLDWNIQQDAEKAVTDGAAQNQQLYQGYNAALVAQDPQTGQVLALVGSRNYFATSSLPLGCTPAVNCKFEPNFDVATQGLRQPGSSLKPFVYLTAFQEGYTPDTVLFDTPTEFTANDPHCPAVPDFSNTNKECFHPQDFESTFAGPMSLRTALAQSVNVPSVKMLYLAGLDASIKNAYTFGLTTLTNPDQYGLSLVLGGGAVKLADLAEAYSVLAADGVKHAQTMVLGVQDANGNTLESWKDDSSRVADSQSVRLVNDILSDTDARAGLFQNSLNLTEFPGYDVALKTGTSNDYRDAWANGYTPSLEVSVWAGNNDNTPFKKNGSSILAAVPIWHEFLASALPNTSSTTFIQPDPTTPAKPILAGNYLDNNQIHTILYYVNKADPTGPDPTNPAADPQFNNWETGVINWASIHIPNFASYNQPFAAGAQTSVSTTTLMAATTTLPPQVQIISPAVGAFFNGTLLVNAIISGASPITGLQVLWNGAVVQQISLAIPKEGYNLDWQFVPQNPGAQNLLEVEATDQNGNSAKSGVIVYAQ